MPSTPIPGSGAAHLLRQVGFLLLGVSVTLAALSASANGNPNAEALYLEASQAFMAKDYQRSVALYRSADTAGYPDPALFYNLGVASYRLGEYDAAEAAFATASTTAALAPLSYYNLGLVALKQGDSANARAWFTQASTHVNASSRMKKLAGRAIDTLPQQRATRPDFDFQTDKPGLSDFLNFSFDTGYGHDSNIYRSPGASYIDLARQGTPLIDPTIQSGAFVPLQADVDFRWGTHEGSHFSLRYDFDGKLFTDARYSNANAFRNEVSVGGKAFIPKKNGYRYFNSRFIVGRYDEQYYDRTDGQDQLVGTVDVSDRFRRTKFGPKIYYHRERGRLGYGLRAEAFIAKYDNNYEEDFTFLDLTHEQYLAGLHVSYDVLRATQLRANYNFYHRNYTNRRARDADGIRFTTNDALQYDYHEAGVVLRQKFGAAWWLDLDYQYTMRRDNFAGYDDYNRHRGRAKLNYGGRRIIAKAGFTYRTYQFPNGYAFDLPVVGIEKTLDTVYAAVELDYRFRPRYSVNVTYLKDIVESSDPRSEYTKNQILLGLRWTL